MLECFKIFFFASNSYTNVIFCAPCVPSTGPGEKNTRDMLVFHIHDTAGSASCLSFLETKNIKLSQQIIAGYKTPKH